MPCPSVVASSHPRYPLRGSSSPLHASYRPVPATSANVRRCPSGSRFGPVIARYSPLGAMNRRGGGESRLTLLDLVLPAGRTSRSVVHCSGAPSIQPARLSTVTGMSHAVAFQRGSRRGQAVRAADERVILHLDAQVRRWNRRESPPHPGGARRAVAPYGRAVRDGRPRGRVFTD